ncbi:hypothetical protein DMH01_39390 [Amycolatopsis sp. WAC 04182]|uniref:hypothetical protein n=1 Tax=Amycolatopsis sp. WAC 04182 TaxID=2203198 RepID=UPI000F7B9720|nr:hypothetical protein [Amycolatopsis sp. WAC 04182]RSN53764.1 hypothetical protein DMH01_39390 [Amycolatopsis sp. WAC 04182]
MSEERGRLAAYWERQQERLDELERKRALKLPAWRTRKRRRTLSVLVVLGDLVLIAGAVFYQTGETGAFLVCWLGGGLVAGGSQYLLRILTGKMSGGFSMRLDEREREMRHRVTYVSYQILMTLMLFAVLYGLLVPGPKGGGAMMACALLVTGSTVAVVILGWSLPDDDPEDFDEVTPA